MKPSEGRSCGLVIEARVSPRRQQGNLFTQRKKKSNVLDSIHHQGWREVYHTHYWRHFPCVLHGTSKKPDSKKQSTFHRESGSWESVAWSDGEALLLRAEASELFGEGSVSQRSRINTIYIGVRGL